MLPNSTCTAIERCLAHHLAAASGTSLPVQLSDGPPLGVKFWPEVVNAFEGIISNAAAVEGNISNDADAAAAAARPRHLLYPLEDGRSRVQGLMTAMSITRIVLLSGAIITMTPTR
jgi:hypothetical protein